MGTAQAQVLAKKGSPLNCACVQSRDADLRQGHRSLLCDFRRARCHPDQIVIVGGLQPGNVNQRQWRLLNRNDAAWIEDPGFSSGPQGFICGAKVVPSGSTGGNGFIARSRKRAAAANHLRNAFTSISLGMTMSSTAGLPCSIWRVTHNTFIFEDDYDSEFRFNRPTTAFPSGARRLWPV